MKKYYPIFKHNCIVVQRRIQERLNPVKPSLEAFTRRRRPRLSSPKTSGHTAAAAAAATAAAAADNNPWARFYFVSRD